jgi:polysaccharide biosynthesis/export protein
MPMLNLATFARSCFALVLAASAVVEASAQTPPATPVPTGVPLAQDYVIGPQDVLGVVFWREPEMSGDVTVRPDGKISLPVIGELQAAGLHPDVLQKQIATAATKYLADPNVAVVVRAINSRRVFVTGKVTTPGSHPLTGPLTVMQSIALAGGLTEYADSKNITVLRMRDGQSQILRFNYKDVAKGKNTDQNILLLPGDTVVVP